MSVIVVLSFVTCKQSDSKLHLDVSLVAARLTNPDGLEQLASRMKRCRYSSPAHSNEAQCESCGALTSCSDSARYRDIRALDATCDDAAVRAN